MNPIVDDLVALCRTFGILERTRICCGTVTVQQCIALQALVQGPSDIGPLAKRVGKSPSAMTRLVDGLLKRGWVERVRDREDRRRVRVTLTATGRDEAQRLRTSTDQAIGMIFALLPREEHDQVVACLKLLRDAMNKTLCLPHELT